MILRDTDHTFFQIWHFQTIFSWGLGGLSNKDMQMRGPEISSNLTIGPLCYYGKTINHQSITISGYVTANLKLGHKCTDLAMHLVKIQPVARNWYYIKQARFTWRVLCVSCQLALGLCNEEFLIILAASFHLSRVSTCWNWGIMTALVFESLVCAITQAKVEWSFLLSIIYL